jgi:hypothetical protein
MSIESERVKILQMIDDGLVSVDEGIELIKALETRLVPGLDVDLVGSPEEKSQFEAKAENISKDIGGATSAAFAPESLPVQTEAAEPGSPSPEPEDLPQPEKQPPDFNKWRSWWGIPMGVGVGITVVSAGLMYLAWRESGMGFWFACTWFPFALGVLVMALAWSSRSARWLHVRIHRQPGDGPRKIAISLPLPLRLTAWFVRTFRGRIPGMEQTGLDELILSLQKTNPDTPFYVEVNEDDDGERVEVYIG